MPPNLDAAQQNYANGGAAEVNASAIGAIAPYASHLSGPVAPLQQYNASPSGTNSTSGLGKVAHFIGGIGGDIGHLAVGATKWLGTNVVNMATSIPREVQGISRGLQDNQQIGWNTQRTQQNSQALSSLVDSYKTGKITKAQYQSGLNDLINSNNKITKDEISLNSKINMDKTDAYKAMIDSAAAVVTVLTSGVGDIGLMPAEFGVKTAADYLASTNANAMLSNVEKGLEQFATDPTAFGKLGQGAQFALQHATAEVIANAGSNMTAGQIARAAAVNVALKYPFYYNYLSATGHQLYQELDQQKYGAAIRTLGFNSLLMLSGGPIGQALKYGGEASKGLAARSFNVASYIDTLSKGVGDGSADGIRQAFHNTDFQDYKFFDNKGQLVTLTKDEAQARLAQNLRSSLAVNLQAVKGSSESDAAWRVLNGMKAYEGIDLSNFTHEEFLRNVSNFAEAQRTADFYGEKAGLGKVTVGRLDTRDLKKVADGVQEAIGTNKATGHAAFDQLVKENPTRAWANNENFIRQIHGLIDKYNSSKTFTKAVKDIDASYRVKGFPTAIAKKLSSMGYIAITPESLDAPFKEGAADMKLSTKFGEDQFFKNTVQPLPVLSSVGKMFEMSGMSPLSSEGAIYRMYNSAVSERLTGMKFLPKKDTPEATADNVLKTLSNWTKQLNAGEVQRGGLPLGHSHVRPPVMDIRQLTYKDTAAALKISHEDAKTLNSELRNAMLDVPLAVRGLGDKTVDVLNNSALFRSYMRIQGAGRFSWNPVFQGKLVAKTESLSQAMAGGKAPVVLENILGKGPAIESTRTSLRGAGMLDAKAAKFMQDARAGGEGALEGISVGANLSHSLLSFQEKSIAGMVNKMADKAGLTPEEFIHQFPQETRDTIQMIAQYDRRSNLLHSPLMRTLNFAFFPLRFETKVATVMAKSLAQTDTLTQVAVINGLMNAHNFMNSPEGMAWYAQNADVLKFLNYFTPTTTLSTAGQLLSGLSHEEWKTTIGAFELGGLPLGWLPQLLNDEGANFSPGYIDPTTGQLIPHQIPNTDKAKLQVAIQDMVGSLFTYPGSELGLPSKSGIDKFIAGGAIGGQAKKSEFTPTTPYLSAQQKQYMATIGGPAQAQLPHQNPPGPVTSTKLPIQGTGKAAPVYKNGPKTPKLKKGQFKAVPL